MSEFFDYIDEALGDEDALTDIRVIVRRCWFYEFTGYPIRLWQGKGKLFTSDGNQWLGSIDAKDRDYHETPAIQDGRDGSSATYNMKLNLVDFPGQTAFQTYDALKSEQWRVSGQKVTCYLAAFKEGEALRPSIPIIFFKELTMMAPKFSEVIEGENKKMVRRYSVSVACKDANFGRSSVPGGTYADTVQKARALEHGVAVDKGAEYLGLLANRTYQLP